MTDRESEMRGALLLADQALADAAELTGVMVQLLNEHELLDELRKRLAGKLDAFCHNADEARAKCNAAMWRVV